MNVHDHTLIHCVCVSLPSSPIIIIIIITIIIIIKCLSFVLYLITEAKFIGVMYVLFSFMCLFILTMCMVLTSCRLGDAIE